MTEPDTNYPQQRQALRCCGTLTARPFLWALLAAAAVLLWQSLNVRYNFGGNWTALFCTGDYFQVPPELRTHTYRFKNSTGYDGQFYRYIAHDPFFKKGYAAFIDDPRLRYRRILVPGLAHLLAFGQPPLIDAALVAVVLLSVFLGVFWSGRWMLLHERSPVWGLLFLLVPATLTSLDRMLVDSFLCALFVGFMVHVRRESWVKVYALCAAAVLTRETGVLMTAAVVVSLLLGKCWSRAALFATSVLPALAWNAYVWQRTPSSFAHEIVTWPALGILRRFLVLRDYPDPQFIHLARLLDVLALCGLLASFALALCWFWKERSEAVAVCVALFVALGLVLGGFHPMLHAYGYARPVSPVLAFVLLRAAASGAWWAAVPPLLPSLSISIYFGPSLVGVLRGVF